MKKNKSLLAPVLILAALSAACGSIGGGQSRAEQEKQMEQIGEKYVAAMNQMKEYFDYGSAYVKQGMFDNAIESFGKALAEIDKADKLAEQLGLEKSGELRASIEKLVAAVKDEQMAQGEAQKKAAEEKRLMQEKAAEEKRLAQEKAAEEERLAREKAAAEFARLTPQWNNEDFGAKAAVAQTFNVTNDDEWNAAMKAIDGGGNNKNYVINVAGNFSGGISFNRIHSGLAVSLRGSGIGENTLSRSSFVVADGETLILRDIAIKGAKIEVAKGGTFVMEGGNIGRYEHYHDYERYTIYETSSVTVAGTFTMKGGTISGSRTEGYYNGAVEVTGTFTMSGGNISGNAGSHGGSVYVSGGTFTMSGGEISDNSDSGVYVSSGTFTMSGGEISGNSGSGMYVSSGTFTMSGGEISGNSGSGVYVSSGTFIMSGGEIGGNRADSNSHTDSTPGGVYVNSQGFFYMSGGTIYGPDAGDKANEGAAIYCANRSRAKYGNGALILEGYRVDYIDETIKGVSLSGGDVIGKWLDENGKTVVIIDRDHMRIAENRLRWNRQGSRKSSGWAPVAEKGFYEIPNDYKDRTAGDSFGNRHGGFRLSVSYSLSDGVLIANVANSVYDNAEGINYEEEQTFRLYKEL